MGIFNFLFRNNRTANTQQAQTDVAAPVALAAVASPQTDNLPKKAIPIAKTSYSITSREKYGVFEYIRFPVAGTSFYQTAIKKAVKEAKADGLFDDEKYDGMSNKEIMEDTFDEPIHELSHALFSDCTLQLELGNAHDPKAIAIYIGPYMVGHVPKKQFLEGKDYLYHMLTGGLAEDQHLHVSVTLRGGKYKINRGGEKVETGESDYKLDSQVIIKSPLD